MSILKFKQIFSVIFFGDFFSDFICYNVKSQHIVSLRGHERANHRNAVEKK
jgi:hypothetical protein